MIKIICVGKVKEKYLRDAISDYEKRISKYYKIDIIEVNDSNMKEEAIKGCRLVFRRRCLCHDT